ncbi:MAG: acyltransferase [Acidobacteriaceae bacterium]|nr:acyltransferase [Acidobacteriaceae bacterium]MBV9442408.1 acyltransferase [Acidobacteriaceae bacterium]
MDGLRAASVALVLLCHFNGSRGFGHLPALIGDIGGLGVRIFFVLSGFLITHLLLNEKYRFGRISLASFYKRRAFRILPVACVYVAVALICGERAADAVPALTFTANYLPTSWTFAHFWSLSVEEQFYVLWPIGLVLLSQKKAVAALAVTLVICPIFRLVHFAAQPDAGWNHFELLGDALAFGCVLAMSRQELLRIRVYRILIRSRVIALTAVMLAWLANATSNHPHFYYGAGITTTIVAIGLVIEHCIQRPPALLNIRPITWIGTLSYSLYVWQQLFLRQFRPGFWMNAFPASIVFTFIAAMLSFYLVEKPFLGLRQRIRFMPARRSTASSPLPTNT